MSHLHPGHLCMAGWASQAVFHSWSLLMLQGADLAMSLVNLWRFIYSGAVKWSMVTIQNFFDKQFSQNPPPPLSSKKKWMLALWIVTHLHVCSAPIARISASVAQSVVMHEHVVACRNTVAISHTYWLLRSKVYMWDINNVASATADFCNTYCFPLFLLQKILIVSTDQSAQCTNKESLLNFLDALTHLAAAFACVPIAM